MINSEFICPACQEITVVRHSIKEKPAPICEACGTAMVREISGGGAMLVQGGKLSSGVEAKISDKDRADMHHAKDIAARMKNFAQPKTQKAFLERPSIVGETEPAATGKRIKKSES